MKSLLKFFIFLAIVLISCNEQKDKRLVNTCWKRYKVEYYDKDINSYDSTDTYNYKEPEYIYKFLEKEYIVSFALKSFYKLDNERLIISGDRHDIIEFNDTVLITLHYMKDEHDCDFPFEYEYFKKLNCDTLPQVDPDTIKTMEKNIFVHRFKYIFSLD